MPFMRKYNTLLVTGTTAIRIPIIKRAVVDYALGADWTPAAGDVKVFVDAAAVANITNLPTAIASGNGAFWEFVLTAAELSCKQLLVVVADAATKAIEDQAFIVETYGNASAMYAADLSLANLPANVTQLLGTAWLTPGTAGTPDVNAKLLGATAQTGRDIGASVLLSTGTGTGQLDFTSGVVKANLVQILATALTETAGLLAGGFKKFFNVATPTGTLNSLADAVPGAAGGGFIAGTNAATAITTALTANVTGNLSGSVGSVTGAVGSVTGAVGSVTGSVGSVTAGVTLAASAVQAIWDALSTALTTVGSIGKRLVDAIPNAVAGAANGLFIAGTNAATAITTALTANITGNLSGSVGSVTGAVGSVTGAVGSVTGLTAATVHADLDDIQARLPAALTGAGNIKADALAINGNATSAAVLAILNGATVVYQGTVTGAATTTTLIDSGLTQADTDWWKGRIIIFTSVLTLQATDITAFDPATDKLTFTAVTAAPTGAAFVII